MGHDGNEMYSSFTLDRPREAHDKQSKKLQNRVCMHCGTSDTPQWRKGPDGKKSYVV